MRLAARYARRAYIALRSQVSSCIKERKRGRDWTGNGEWKGEVKENGRRVNFHCEN